MDNEEQDNPIIEPFPAEPSSPMQQAAITYHEIFIQYQAGGFTRDEALAIVIALITQKRDS